MRVSASRCLLAAAAALVACGGRQQELPPTPTPGALETPAFIDVTDELGVSFVHVNGASPDRLLPETMGSGAALFDYDGDGWVDLYLVNGAPLGGGDGAPASGALYRNVEGRRLVEVTDVAGLRDSFAGMGAAVGDVDRDGWVDLFVSGVDAERLYLNTGGGFRDATAELGLSSPGFGTSSAFLDYDEDGWLDLFVGRYVEWTAADDLPCRPDGTHRAYCTPEIYHGQSNRLYRGNGDDGFEDVTKASGIWHPEGKTLGVAVFDHDGDGRPDLAVANDTVRNFLFVNRGDGSFAEEGVEAGFAFSPSGATRGGMGIAAGDLDGDGREDLVIGNFAQEMAALYRAQPGGLYRDVAAEAGLGMPTLMSLAFGTLLLDQNGDGSLDLLVANGHIEPQIAVTQPVQSYAQRAQLFLGSPPGFTAWDPPAGDALAQAYVGRGLCTGDLDADGDPDVVLTQNGGRARILRNAAPPGRWLAVRPLVAGAPALGTRVEISAGARSWRRWLTSGGSYLSASEPKVLAGLGDTARLDRFEVRWPDGRLQRLVAPPVDREYVLSR